MENLLRLVMNKVHALKLAIELAGGQSALAEKLTVRARKINLIAQGKTVSQQSVYNWLTRQKQSPSKFALLIAEVVNQGVTANQLRPDLYPNDTSA
jgi:DNA-binding transcriptional regulator YdaS (Cro superfamily)